ncbi:MAG: hemoglobin [Methylococcaceae bacterium NSP1-1]|nr:MAG: hemoglobin [Methylococcaceae bacterium NSP1-1]
MTTITPYDVIGGEQAILSLVERFYFYMDSLLRARHLPFAIGESERDQWMLCMNKALAEMTMDPRLKTNLQNALQQLATHMINQELDQESGTVC